MNKTEKTVVKSSNFDDNFDEKFKKMSFSDDFFSSAFDDSCFKKEVKRSGGKKIKKVMIVNGKKKSVTQEFDIDGNLVKETFE